MSHDDEHARGIDTRDMADQVRQARPGRIEDLRHALGGCAGALRARRPRGADRRRGGDAHPGGDALRLVGLGLHAEPRVAQEADVLAFLHAQVRRAGLGLHVPELVAVLEVDAVDAGGWVGGGLAGVQQLDEHPAVPGGGRQGDAERGGEQDVNPEILAAIHGDEAETTVVVSEALRTLPTGDLQAAVILCGNPDGMPGRPGPREPGPALPSDANVPCLRARPAGAEPPSGSRRTSRPSSRTRSRPCS